MIDQFEIGSLYKWIPEKWEVRPEEQTYSILIGEYNEVFNRTYSSIEIQHLTVGGMIVPLERRAPSKDTSVVDYRIITTTGIVGWIRVSSRFINDWVLISL